MATLRVPVAAAVVRRFARLIHFHCAKPGLVGGQSGYRSRISLCDAEYFNLSIKDARVAKAARPERVPTLEQIRHVLNVMPTSTEIQLRDRALVAFTLLTGARDGAVASLKLGHVDVACQRFPKAMGVEVRQRLRELGLHTPEHYKAWSQNLDHASVLTTFSSYGNVNGYRQMEIIQSLGSLP